MGSHEKPAGLILITVDGGSQHRCRGRVGSAVGHAQGGYTGYPVQPEDVTQMLFFSLSVVSDSL